MVTIKMDIPTDTAHLAIILERWYYDAVLHHKVFGTQPGGELVPYRSHESGFNYTHSGHQIVLGIHGQLPNNRATFFRDLIHIDAYEITGQLTRLTLQGKPGYDDAVNDLARFIEQHFTPQPIEPEAQRVTSEVSGGVNVDADNLTVGKDMVGRDKIIQADTYIESATFIQSDSSAQEIGPTRGAPSLSGKAARSSDNPMLPGEVWLSDPNNRRVIAGLEFVRITAGAFLMGSTDDDPLASDAEKPQHAVEIPYDYWIARYPVTNELFAAFLEAELDLAKRIKKLANKLFGDDTLFDVGPDIAELKNTQQADHPVHSVLWKEAMAYCTWLDEKLRSDLGELTLRLPTEAEWEKAARGGLSPVVDGRDIDGNREWPWGNKFDKAKCNSAEGGKTGTTRVGAYSPQGDSPYGVADMAGNVWEWCHSLYKPYPYIAGKRHEDESDSGYRVQRGGSFYNDLRMVRCAYRDVHGTIIRFDPKATRPAALGFRVVVAPVLS